jgi:hypothetical protein
MRPAFDPRPRRGQALAPTNPWSYREVWLGPGRSRMALTATALRMRPRGEDQLDEALRRSSGLPSRFPLRTLDSDSSA